MSRARQTMGEALAELAQAWNALVFELRTVLGLAKPAPPRFTTTPCNVCPDHPLVLDAQDPSRQLPVFDFSGGEAEAKAAKAVAALNDDPDAELSPGLYWEPRT